MATGRGSKDAYTDKQKRQAEHIEEGYEQRDGGGKKSGSGRGHAVSHEPSRKGGHLGGEASASRPASERSASAKKAAETRRRNAEHGTQRH